MPRRFHQLDVFTAIPLKGNPLAVVHDAQGLDDATMTGPRLVPALARDLQAMAPFMDYLCAALDLEF